MKQKTTERAKHLFSLGTILLTSRAAAALTNRRILDALDRHQNGDWGSVSDAEREANNDATRGGLRIISRYESGYGLKFCIITEWDQSSTTVLLGKEYEPDEDDPNDWMFDDRDWIEED
jgi:hypothetical protein